MLIASTGSKRWPRSSTVTPRGSPGGKPHKGELGRPRWKGPSRAKLDMPAAEHRPLLQQLRFEGARTPDPSLLTGTRDEGRAPSQAFPQRAPRHAQGQWRGNRFGAGLRQRESDAATPAPTSVALGLSPYSLDLDLDLPWITARLGSQLHPRKVLSRVRWLQRKRGKCNTMPTISVAAAANHATGRLWPILCWCQHQKGGREPPCCSIWPRSTKTRATTTSCRKDMRYVLIQPPHMLVSFTRRMTFFGGRRGGLSAVPDGAARVPWLHTGGETSVGSPMQLKTDQGTQLCFP